MFLTLCSFANSISFLLSKWHQTLIDLKDIFHKLPVMGFLGGLVECTNIFIDLVYLVWQQQLFFPTVMLFLMVPPKGMQEETDPSS
jgi:hypothetical protein